MPPQTLYSKFCFLGSRLQPLPSHSSTNSRRRTATPAAYRAAHRPFFFFFFFLSRFSPSLIFPTSRCSGNLRFCREPSCDEELHSMFVVSPSSKNNQLAAVWARLCFSRRVFKRALLHGKGAFFSLLFSPRGAVELLVWEITICPCFSLAPNRPSNTKVVFFFFFKDEMIRKKVNNSRVLSESQGMESCDPRCEVSSLERPR